MPTPARTTQAARIRESKKTIDAAESKQKRQVHPIQDIHDPTATEITRLTCAGL
jgi:hypothetical protein